MSEFLEQSPSNNMPPADLKGSVELPPQFDRLAIIGNDKRVIDAMLKPISENWISLSAEDQNKLSRALGEVHAALENYQGKLRSYGLAAKYRRAGESNEVSGFQDSDEARHIAHERLFDALNALSRGMKEMGLSNSWRSKDAIYSPPAGDDYRAMKNKIASWALDLNLDGQEH